MKKTLFAALLTCVLVSCAPNVTFTPQATVAQIPVTETLSPLPTFTPPPFIAFPTLPDLPPITVTPTQTPLPAVLPKFPLDRYVMLFTKDGNLYFQDGENTSVKLTHVGEKALSRILSDDNKKVVFTRDNSNNIYSINTDGTQEQVVIPNNWLDSLGAEAFMGFLNFVPKTHVLFFEAVLCKSQEWGSPCSASLYIANADTGEFKKLTDLGLAYQQNTNNKNIIVSPNGKMIAVGTMDGMDIFTLDGEAIRDDILPYKPSTSTVLFSSLFWLPDSSGLILAIPDTIYDSQGYDRFPGHTLWRYTIDNNIVTPIPLASPLPGNGRGYFDISPDGNWSIYGGIGGSGSDLSLYIGNLTNGYTQIFGDDIQPSFSWAPDSKHFIYTSTSSTLGTVDQPSILTPTCYLLHWIDAKHFTCDNIENKSFRVRMAEITGGIVKIYDLGFDKDIENSVFIKPK